MGTAPLASAFAFASHGDWARVIPSARQALSDDPQNADAHALLALGLSHLEQARNAVQAGRRAVALDPESPFAHYALGWALLEHDDAAGAERSAREALRLDPDGSAHALLGHVLARQRRWEEALETADRGLQVEPEHSDCANIRAMALGSLGRGEEAKRAVHGVLTLDPDNAYAHANRGWLMLRQGKPDEALESFRAALRLDPSLEWARSGIIEALKARHGIYRTLLRYVFWMGRLTNQQQWMVIIGLFVAARVGRTMMRQNPELAPVLGPALAIYTLFVFGTWIAEPLSNLLLRFNAFGRLALRRHEILASNLIAGCVGAFVVAALLFATTRTPGWFLVGASSILMLIPIGGAFQGYGTRAWRPLLAILLVLAACAAATSVLAFVDRELAYVPLVCLVGGVMLFGWFGNYLIIKFQ